MHPARRLILASLRDALGPLAIALLLAGPAVAADERDGAAESPESLAVEGLQRLMEAFSLFVDQIPQYEPPEILDNGDIIIRRKRSEPVPPPARPEPPSGEDDSPDGGTSDTI